MARSKKTTKRQGGIKVKELDFTQRELTAHHKWVGKAIRFMDKELKRLDRMENPLSDWKDVKQEMSSLSGRIRAQCEGIPKKMSEVIVFSAFEDAIDRKRKQLCPQFREVVEDWWDSVPEHQAPLYHEVVNVGLDMGKGYSEKEARKFHTDWLDSEQGNREYDNYYYFADGTIINMNQNMVGEA